MDEGLYRHILSQLEEAGTVRRFVPMLQSEPLVDRKIADRIREAREALGRGTRIYIVTNGVLFVPEVNDELYQAGTDVVSISIDAFREETYRSIRKGLDFSKVVGNVRAALERERHPTIVARFLEQRLNHGEREDFVRYWKSLGAGVFIHPVVNRAGALGSIDEIAGQKVGIVRRIARRILNRALPFCPLPFHSLSVLWDGRAILCCHDWGPEVVVGDLTKQTIEEVWNGEAINHYRHLLRDGRVAELEPCSDCSLGRKAWGVD